MSSPDSEAVHAPDRRKPRAVLLIVVGAVLGAGLTFAFFGLGGRAGSTMTNPIAKPSAGAPTPSDAMSPSMQGPSTAAGSGVMGDMTPRQALLFHVPPPISRSCVPGDRQDVRSFTYFSVVCHPDGPVAEVQYSSFHDAESMRAKFEHDLSAAGLGGSAGPAACSTAAGTGYGGWWMDDAMGNARRFVHRVSGTPRPWSTHGRLMCYWQGDRATIEWYDNDTHIYAWASASQDQSVELFRWWADQAGPQHPRLSAGGM